MPKKIAILTMLVTNFLTSGCETDDERLAKLATDSAERQARQSEILAKAHADLTQGARQLVESVGRSQESLVTVQQGLEQQQAEIGHQRDLLEKERQTIAAQRRTDPIIANALVQIGLLVACVLPLVICWYLLTNPGANDADRLVSEILIEDLTAKQPRLTAGPPAASAEPKGHLPPPQ
jgi:hypothetical protein